MAFILTALNPTEHLWFIPPVELERLGGPRAKKLFWRHLTEIFYVHSSSHLSSICSFSEVVEQAEHWYVMMWSISVEKMLSLL